MDAFAAPVVPALSALYGLVIGGPIERRDRDACRFCGAELS